MSKQMDESAADRVWCDLRQSLAEIQTGSNRNKSMSFGDLHRKAYDLVLCKHSNKLYSGYKQLVIDHLRNRIRQTVLDAMNDHFLETLARVWDSFRTAEQMNRDVMMYFEKNELNNKYMPIFNLALSLFRDEIINYPAIKESIRASLLSLISLERTKEAVEWMLIKSASQMLKELSLGNRLCYKEVFEKSFLGETKEHYQRVARKIIAENCAGAYAFKVNEYFAEEIDRASRYLDKQTCVEVESVLCEVFIEKHMINLLELDSGFKFIVDNSKIDELCLIYELLGRLKNGQINLSQIMGNDLQRKGREIAEGADTIDPLTFVQGLLNLMEQFERIIVEAFKNDQIFSKQLKTDFEYVLNLNAKAPEFISLYIDDKLKKGAKLPTENETCVALNKAVLLFRFLHEKDLFQRYYKHHLAKRLLNDRSGSKDAEESMITKLKTECGIHYTAELEGMLRDMESSEELMNKYGETAERNKGIELSMRILTSGKWPISNRIAPCKLSKSLKNSFEHFRKFYSTKHSGRTISLSCSLGNADVKATFSGNPNLEKILNVSTCQMIVLLIFNEHTTISFQRLFVETEIEEMELKRCLQSLAEGKLSQRILVRMGNAGKEIEGTDQFCVNENFTSKLKRIKVQMGSYRAETEAELKATRDKVDAWRKLELEAAVVRVMKARRTVEHNELFTEVCTQLKARFLPDPQLMKQRVESLIEREFLARNETNHKQYTYIA